MYDSTSTRASGRPRARRVFGAVVGAAVLLPPALVAAPASAQSGNFDSIPIISGLLGGLPAVAEYPLGKPAPGATPCTSNCVDGVGSAGTAVIGPAQNALQGPPKVKARVKASMRKGKARSVRWVAR